MHLHWFYLFSGEHTDFQNLEHDNCVQKADDQEILEITESCPQEYE